MYNVIQRSSAVKSKWRAVFTFNTILVNKIKKIIKIKFKSPKTIIYYADLTYLVFLVFIKLSSRYEQLTECTSKIIK